MVENFNPGDAGDAAQLAGHKLTSLRSDGCLTLVNSMLDEFLNHPATAAAAGALQTEHATVYLAKSFPRLQRMDMAAFLSKDAEKTITEVAYITTGTTCN